MTDTTDEIENSATPSKVQLYIYDLSNGMASAYGAALLGIDIQGVWHSSVVVDGKEIYFGQGIQITAPGKTHLGAPHRVIDLGTTEVPWPVIEDYISDLREKYNASTYHLLSRNCNDFSNDLAQFLTGHQIPSYVRDVASQVANTPFGQVLAQNLNGQSNVYGLQ